LLYGSFERPMITIIFKLLIAISFGLLMVALL